MIMILMSALYASCEAYVEAALLEDLQVPSTWIHPGHRLELTVTIAYVLNHLEGRNPCMESKVNVLARGHGYSAACLRRTLHKSHHQLEGGALIDIIPCLSCRFETTGFA